MPYTNDQLSTLPKGLARLTTSHVRAPLKTLVASLPGWTPISNDARTQIQLGNTADNATCHVQINASVGTVFAASTTRFKRAGRRDQQSTADFTVDDILLAEHFPADFQQIATQRFVMPLCDRALLGNHIGILIAEKTNDHWSFTYIDPKRPSVMTPRVRAYLKQTYPGCTFRAIETNQQAWLNDTTCGYHMLANIEAVLTLLHQGKAPAELTAAMIRTKAKGSHQSSVAHAILTHHLGKNYGFAPLPTRRLIARAFDDIFNLHRYVDENRPYQDITNSPYFMAQKTASRGQRLRAFLGLPAKPTATTGAWLTAIISLPLTLAHHLSLKPLIYSARLIDLSLQASVDELKIQSMPLSSLGILAAQSLRGLVRLIGDGLQLASAPLDGLQYALRYPGRTLKHIFKPWGQAALQAFDETYYTKEYGLSTDNTEPSDRDRIRAFFEWKPLQSYQSTSIRLMVITLKSLSSLISLPFNLLKLPLMGLKTLVQYVKTQYDLFKESHQAIFTTDTMRHGSLSYDDAGNVEPSAMLLKKPAPLFTLGLLLTARVVTQLAHNILYPASQPKAYWRETWQQAKLYWTDNSKFSQLKATGFFMLRSMRFLGSNILVASVAISIVPLFITKTAIAQASQAISQALPVLTPMFNTLGIQAARMTQSLYTATLAGAASAASTITSAVFQSIRRVWSYATNKQPSGANSPPLSNQSQETTTSDDEWDIPSREASPVDQQLAGDRDANYIVVYPSGTEPVPEPIRIADNTATLFSRPERQSGAGTQYAARQSPGMK